GEIDFHLDVMGKVWDQTYLRNRVDELGIGRHVTLHGFVEEDFLDAKLKEAHLVFNLRNPTMGEASGSQMRIWNAAAPSVVTDLGWYADLPDDTVFKIDPENELTALQTLIRQLAVDPTAGRSIATAGRARLEARHGPARYAAAVAEVAGRFNKDAATALKAKVMCGTSHRFVRAI
ncbi:MAG: glycosyltransferase family 1 protein, partial [Sulfitobacter sp.]